MEKWQKVFESASLVRAEIVKGVLSEHDITAIVLNKKESVYQIIGSYHVMVVSEKAFEAANLIKNEISF
ncbi:putative signal transducing protein [Echinicola vietnamensis]|uniref:DUF2007 domain-containing protein n=1 Tax=Echinicola vietnamensis (strain DSM 17526 / LMG 23754 / KMM 6221) TaxID=926556 RepID=L0FXL6_ECHVK|nr:DUF2007 domain-containing protein [Echinicola vietnamensis]AGA77798.1 hypothetical protein Echvi_1533 [Echinicola vietnamensis DSM 17526]